MKSVRNILFVFFCLFAVTSAAYAQYHEETKRKWALSYKASPWVRPVLTDNPSDKSLGRGFSAFSVMGEYYLPKKITAEAGYFRTELSYGGPEAKKR